MPGFAHKLQDFIRNMLRCYSQLTADVILYEFTEKFVIFIFNKVIKTDSAADKYLFNARQFPDFTHQLYIIFMVDRQVLARLRK